MRTHARHRFAKCCLDPVDVDESAGPSDRVEHRDRLADEPVVPVRVEPVEGGACGASTVEARCADDNDLIGGGEDPASRRFENPGTRVEADEVVVALEKRRSLGGILLTDACVILGSSSDATTSSLLGA